jgi:DNA polymerase
MLDQAGAMVRRGNFPQLLDADRVGLRIVPVAQVEARHQTLAERAAAAFGEQRVAGAQLHAASEIGGRRAILADPHVAGGDAGDAAVLLEQLGGGEPGIDLDAELLGLGCQPAADIAKRNDIVAVVVHLRRRRQAERASLRQEQEPIILGWRGEWRAPVRPIRDQFVQRARFQYGAGQDVRTHLAALFHHAHRGVGRELLQADRRRQPGRTGAHDHHVELHRLAWR